MALQESYHLVHHLMYSWFTEQSDDLLSESLRNNHGQRPATDVFHDWALVGKDEGMERGHAASVSEMLSFISKQVEVSSKAFSAVDVGCAMDGLFVNYSLMTNVNMLWELMVLKQ